MNKTARIKTNIGSDSVLRFNLSQDVDFLEVLSLQLSQKNAYMLHTSNYGIIMGRVLANDAFGIPNAKVSVFISLTDEDAQRNEITSLYPYTSVTTKDNDEIRYNLLKDESSDECYRTVGTFPNKRLVLDDETEIEIFDKYWKYTTVTNQAGDYMIFGVPCGQQTVHIDIDLSDIGILSQSPRDFIYKGYNITQFDNPSQFKQSTNLENLSQIIKQDNSIYVYPFWGDSDEGEIAITRCDAQIQYKFEPTCIFMGSTVTDNYSNDVNHKCKPSKNVGYNRGMVTTEGTIEMIRKTTDGYVEQYQIQGNELIDGDGVWCYQIPMNLDYIGTDEFGNIVPTDNPNKGIPTKTTVRFRFTLQETGNEGISRHRARYLVPNNPILTDDEYPTIPNGKTFESCYEFGSATKDSDFRDLYWNKVYTIKSYVPRIQTTKNKGTRNYTALKTVNYAEDNNPIPFNRVRIRLPFGYKVLCLVCQILIALICAINFAFISVIDAIKIPWPINLYLFHIGCISFNMDFSEDDAETGVAYLPCCRNKNALKSSPCPDGMDKCTKEYGTDELMNKIQQNLGQEYEVANLDFYNDWINGLLYFPLWFWRKTKKKKFLFGLFSLKAQNVYCSCDKRFKKARLVESCAIPLKGDTSSEGLTLQGKNDNGYYHRYFNYNNIIYGFVYEKTNKEGLKIYYYTPGAPQDVNFKSNGKSIPYLRLFSTDIVLLGSLNSCDIEGLPQFFSKLPSTTANILEIARVLDEAEDNNGDSDNIQEAGIESDTSGTGLIERNGMDWESEDSIMNGLVFDLSCTKAKTRMKSCVNVSRICELGVTYDSAYDEHISNGSAIEIKQRTTDGLITRYEIEDNESRAIFASLNMNGLRQKYFDSDTNYQKNALKYTYPIDFDGKMRNIIKKDSNDTSLDIVDKSYMQFRFGGDSVKKYSFEETAEFYLYENSFYFYFGLKEGSTAIDKFNKLFYSDCFDNTKIPFTYTYEISSARFNPRTGATSSITIDNKDYVDHFEYGTILFNISKIKTPYSYTLYDSNDNEIMSESNITKNFLIFGGVLSGETYLTYEKAYEVIYDDYSSIDKSKASLGFEEGSYVRDGILHYSNGDVACVGGITDPCQVQYLTNGTYTLELTDANGISTTQTINLQATPIENNYVFTNLKDTYVGDNVEDERKKFCKIDKDNKSTFGKIVIENINLDNIHTLQHDDVSGDYYENYINIKEVVYSSTTSNTLVLKVVLTDSLESKSISGTSVLIEITELDGDTADTVADWCCIECLETYIEKFNSHEFNSITIPIFKPTTYTMVTTQLNFDGVTKTSNTSSEILNILNGNEVDVIVGDVPSRWLLNYQNSKNESDYNPYFYNSGATESTDIKGWFLLHTDKPYVFPQTSTGSTHINQQRIDINEGQYKIWNKFIAVSYASDENGDDNKKRYDDDSYYTIAAYKLDNAFAAAHQHYITNEESEMFSLNVTVKDGEKPILLRSITPNYDENIGNYTYDSIGSYQAINNFCSIGGYNMTYKLNESNSYYNELTPLLSHYSDFNKHLLGLNYSLYEPDIFADSTFNDKIETIGGYLAAFTLNGGYKTNTCIVDSTLSADTLSWPTKATVKVYQEEICPNAYSEDYKAWENPLRVKGVKHYFRAQTIDRRLDYSLWIYLPPERNSVSDCPMVNSARIYGSILNGIEMPTFEFNNSSSNILYSGATYIDSNEKEHKVPYVYETINNVASSLTGNFYFNTESESASTYQTAVLVIDGDKNRDIRKMITNRDTFAHPLESGTTSTYFVPTQASTGLCRYEATYSSGVGNIGKTNYISDYFPSESGDVTSISVLSEHYPIARHVNLVVPTEITQYIGLDIMSHSYEITVGQTDLTIDSSGTTIPILTAETKEGDEAEILVGNTSVSLEMTEGEASIEYAANGSMTVKSVTLIIDNVSSTTSLTAQCGINFSNLNMHFICPKDNEASQGVRGAHRTFTYNPYLIIVKDKNGNKCLEQAMSGGTTPQEIVKKIHDNCKPQLIGMREVDGIQIDRGPLNTGFFSSTTIGDSVLFKKETDSFNLVFDDDSLNNQAVYELTTSEGIEGCTVGIWTEKCYINDEDDDDLLKEVKVCKLQSVFALNETFALNLIKISGSSSADSATAYFTLESPIFSGKNITIDSCVYKKCNSSIYTDNADVTTQPTVGTVCSFYLSNMPLSTYVQGFILGYYEVLITFKLNEQTYGIIFYYGGKSGLYNDKYFKG